MSPASAFDRKPTLPRLMPMSGTSTSVTAIAARRNVPSPPRTTRTSVVGQLADECRGVARGQLPLPDATHPAPARRARAQLDRRPRSSGCRRTRSGPPSWAGDLGDPLADLGTARPGREVDEELAVAVRPGDRRGDDRAGAQADALACVDGPLEDLAMDRRVADDAVVGPAAAGLELRLDERDDVAASRPEGRGDRAEDQRERDERDVDRGDVDRLRAGWRRSGSGRWSAPSRPPAGRDGATRRAVRDRRRARRHGSRHAAAGRR